jgi:hypothetical protein
MGQAERKALKPECISAEIERAMARAARPRGHTGRSGRISAMYSMMASESQTATLPSTRAGTLPAAEYLRTSAFHSGVSIGSVKGTSTSSNGTPSWRMRIQGLSDQDEWHLLPMTRVGMGRLLPSPRRGLPPVFIERRQTSNHEAWPWA